MDDALPVALELQRAAFLKTVPHLAIEKPFDSKRLRDLVAEHIGDDPPAALPRRT